jgi:hypothetical protein
MGDRVTTTPIDEGTAGDAAAPSSSDAGGSGGTRTLLLAVGAGAAVSLAAGVYGRNHTPTGNNITTFGFPEVLSMKVWLTTGAVLLAFVQLASASWMFGRLPGVSTDAPRWAVHGHRWFGTVAFLLTLPVAYHCLWSLGFQDTNGRVLAHSLLGCAFYGAFTTKMLALRSDRIPTRTLPIVGGLLTAIIVAIWWTSSWWFFTTIGFPGV